MRLSAALCLLLRVITRAPATAALRQPTPEDVRDVRAIIVAEIEASTCPSDPHSIDFHTHWDRNGLSSSIVADGGGAAAADHVDCVLYPQSKGPRPMGAKLVRLAHADAAGIADGFVNLADRANNGGLESAVFLLDALYDSGIVLDSSGERIYDVISKADLYAWAGAFGAEYAASFGEEDVMEDGKTTLPAFELKWGRKTYVPTGDSDRGPVETFVPASAGWAKVGHYFFNKFGLDERQAATLMGAHSLGSAASATVPPFGGFWTSTPDVFDARYYGELSNPVPLAVTCGDAFGDPKTCEELPDCSALKGGDESLLAAAAHREEDEGGGSRCHGWEQIQRGDGSGSGGSSYGGYQWSHSCDADGKGCSPYGLLLNVDAGMYYNIDDYVDGSTGAVTALPPGGLCGDFVAGMRVFLRCFEARGTDSTTAVLDHRDDPEDFMVEFASVYDILMTVNVVFADGEGLYGIGDAGSYGAVPGGGGGGIGGGSSESGGGPIPAAGTIPNTGECPLTTSADSSSGSGSGSGGGGCHYGHDSGNPFLCLACRSGMCGLDTGDEYPQCRGRDWRPANPPPPPPPPPEQSKPPPAGVTDKIDTLDECPVDHTDAGGGCYYKRGATANPFVCFHCKSNICGLDLAGKFVCRPVGWSAKHAALPPAAATGGDVGQGQETSTPAVVPVGKPCPFQSDNAYGECFRPPPNDGGGGSSSNNPFSCRGCASNVCGVGSSDGQALCRDDWWCPGDNNDAIASSTPPAAPLDADGKVHLEGPCPLQTESNTADCYYLQVVDQEGGGRNPFLCDGCASGVCGVDHYGDARCRFPGWTVEDLALGEACPLNAEGCAPPLPPSTSISTSSGENASQSKASAIPFPCSSCETNYCGLTHFGDGQCVEPGWRLGGLQDGDVCPFEEEGCLLGEEPGGWPCKACASGVCALGDGGDARCGEGGEATDDGEVGGDGDDNDDGKGSGELDGQDSTTGKPPEEATGVQLPPEAEEGTEAATGKGDPVGGDPVGEPCALDESSEESDCYYDTTANPFECLPCASGLCGVDDGSNALCVEAGWVPPTPGGEPGQELEHPESSEEPPAVVAPPTSASIANGDSCVIPDASPETLDGCLYDGTANPFECDLCASASCGVFGLADARCVDGGWQPGQPAPLPAVTAAQRPATVLDGIPDGEECPAEDDDGSGSGSNCFFHTGGPNPFLCGACASKTCGKDTEGTFLCRPVGWTPPTSSEGKDAPASSGKIPDGGECPHDDDSSPGSVCYYHSGGPNPFKCGACESNVCGRGDLDDTAFLCRAAGWTPPPPPASQSAEEPASGGASTTPPGEGSKVDDPDVPGQVLVGQPCDLGDAVVNEDESSSSRGCVYDSGGDNPFNCTTCATGVCGVDAGGFLCRAVDWTTQTASQGEDKPAAPIEIPDGEDCPRDDCAQPPEAEAEATGQDPVGEPCALDESSEESGCFYDTTENPFECRACATGVCGKDNDGFLCRDGGWAPPPTGAIQSADTPANPVEIVDGEECPYDNDSAASSDCYFVDDGPNPFNCSACQSNVCGKDIEGDVLCRPMGWTSQSAEEPAPAKIQDDKECPYDDSSPASECYVPDDGPNPFNCSACQSNLCGKDSEGNLFCRAAGWIPPTNQGADKPAPGTVAMGQLCDLDESGDSNSSGCFRDGTQNPFSCRTCDTGVCGVVDGGGENAVCVEVGWTPGQQQKLPAGDLCPFKANGCLKVDGSQPWSCDACESEWCNTNSYGEAQCFKRGPDTPKEGLRGLPDGDFCPYHREGCEASEETPNPWQCKFCKSGVCGEDMDGNAQCRSSQWTAPKLMDGNLCPFRSNGCLFKENGGPEPWSCDACESGWCNLNGFGDAKCFKHSTNMAPSNLTDLSAGESCPYHEEDCHASSDAAPANPWPCKFCQSGFCGEDSSGNAQCRNETWYAPRVKDGEQCPYRKEGCAKPDEDSSSVLTWSCDSCESGSCGQDIYGTAKCVKQAGDLEPKVDQLDDGEFCHYHQEGCRRTYQTAEGSATNPWECKFCRSGNCGEDSQGDARCRGRGWKAAPPQPPTEPVVQNAGKQKLDIGDLCPLEDAGCVFDSAGSNPWVCSACASGSCGEDHYGDAKCVEQGREKVELEVGERCPLNLIDKDSGCYHADNKKSRPFICLACATNICGIDSSGEALCREKGWKPAGKVRGRALLNG